MTGNLQNHIIDSQAITDKKNAINKVRHLIDAIKHNVHCDHEPEDSTIWQVFSNNYCIFIFLCIIFSIMHIRIVI